MKSHEIFNYVAMCFVMAWKLLELHSLTRNDQMVEGKEV